MGEIANIWWNKEFPCLFFPFYAIDVSPTGNPDCEISAQKCQPPLEKTTRTVTPKDSKVTFNCSIKNGGKVQDMTWQYVEKHLNASDAGLFLQQIDSKNRSHPRECFSIKYASEYVLQFFCVRLIFEMDYNRSSECLVTGLGRFKFSWGNFYGWIDRKNGWSYSPAKSPHLNMVHRWTLVAHAMLEGKQSKVTWQTTNKGIILNDFSFLFGLTQCPGSRSPLWQVCTTKMTYCKGPI